MEHYTRSALAVLALLLLQTTFVPFLSIGGFLPDPLLLWVVYVAIRRGQMEATITGFLAGLLQDAVSMQFFGLSALTKTIAGFVAGYFFNDNNTEQTLGSYRFLTILFLSSFVHNIVYYGIFLQGIQDSVFSTMIGFSIATSLYTVVVGVFPMFTFVRKYRFSQSL
ncbi:MAG: rod shape-determining protein MreD [Ignavibacteria bacterium]|nr:rod shape-determining protein MreD [Ignavibacteria bacterium]